MGKAVVCQTQTPEQTAETAATLAAARVIRPPFCIYLSGDLGSGKTLWARALLRASGCAEEVLSPSYALAYSYPIGGVMWHHLDCYRLQGKDPGEEILSLLNEDSVALVEWESEAAWLPAPDLRVGIEFLGDGDGDGGGGGRRLSFTVCARRAEAALTPVLETLRRRVRGRNGAC